MRRLLIRSKRRVLIASDYLERALAPGRASTRQSRPDPDRSRTVRARSFLVERWFLPCGHGQQGENGSETCRVDKALVLPPRDDCSCLPGKIVLGIASQGRLS